MPPGIEASPDKMLQVKKKKTHTVKQSKFFDEFQGRLFSYADTHLHRVGTNHHLIPVNNPETNKNVKVCTYQRDGAMQTGNNQGQFNRINSEEKKIILFFSRNLGNAPNYYRNTFNGPDVTDRNRHTEHATFESGMAARHDASEDDNYSQPRVFYQVRRKIFISINFYFFCRKSQMIADGHI